MSNGDCMDEEKPDVRTLTVIDGRSSKLCCLSEGWYPSPEMTVYVERRDVTALFAMRYEARLDGQPGLRQMRYTTERFTTDFVVNALDHGTYVKCIVAVPGLTSNFTSLRLNVVCKFCAITSE